MGLDGGSGGISGHDADRLSMFLSNLRLLLRRWYVVVLGLQATILLAFLAVLFVPVKYQATSSVLLLPPKTASGGPGSNPFLSLGGLDVVAGVVARAVTDRATQEDVVASGGTGTYTVKLDQAAGGPVLLVTVEDTTSSGTLRTLDIVTQRLPKTLADVQAAADVSGKALIGSRPITRDTTTETVRKPQIRALLAVTAVGLAGTVLLASFIDGYLLRRAQRRKAPPLRRARSSGSNGRPASRGSVLSSGLPGTNGHRVVPGSTSAVDRTEAPPVRDQEETVRLPRLTGRMRRSQDKSADPGSTGTVP
jgi:hypothetical protein